MLLFRHSAETSAIVNFGTRREAINNKPLEIYLKLIFAHYCSFFFQICEEAVVLRPSCSQALYRLGDAQLLCYDNDPIGNPEMLREAEVSYRVSIELEGKPANDPSTHYDIVVTEWWKNKLEKDKMLKPTTAKAKHPEKKMTNTKPMHKNETSVKGKGTPGKNQTSTAAKTAGRGGTQSSKGNKS